jgi:hypothetical protein
MVRYNEWFRISWTSIWICKMLCSKEELNDTQLKRFENISYKWWNCQICSKKFGKFYEVKRNATHCDKNILEISFSLPNYKENLVISKTGIILELFVTIIHEIVHIIYPNFNEKETIEKTWNWIIKNQWTQGINLFPNEDDKQRKDWTLFLWEHICKSISKFMDSICKSSEN